MHPSTLSGAAPRADGPVVTSELAPAPILDRADGELVLRICGPSRRGQLIRLRSPKCTIGSGPECTLRLSAAGVQPMHCLIVRGHRRTVVRRLGLDTRLNGRTFGDAELLAGDRLSFGPVELEVVASPPPAEVGPAAAGPAAEVEAPPDGSAGRRDDAAPRDDVARREATVQRQRADALARRLALANRQGRQRVRRLIERLRAADRLAEQLHRQKERIEAQKNALTQRSEELERLAQQRQAEHGRWEAERDRWEADREQREVQAELRQAERQQAEEELARREEKLASRADELEARWAELESRQDELDSGRAALEEERRQWEARQGEAGAELARRQAELDARAAELELRQAELDSGRAALEEERRQWEASQGEGDAAQAQPAEEAPSERSSEEAPVDLESVLRKMGSFGLLREDEEDGEEAGAEEAKEDAEAAMRPPSEQFASDAVQGVEGFDPGQPADGSPAETPDGLDRAASADECPAGADGADDEEESIDDYMAQLMARVRGTAGEPEPRRETAAPSPESPAAPAEKPTAPPPLPDRDSTPADEDRGPVEVPPRAAAPERHVDLSAMRELANLSAKTAISHHDLGRLRLMRRTKLAIALGASAVGAALLWLWRARGADEVAFYAAMTGFTVALFWGIQYLMLTGRLLMGRRERRNSGAKVPTSTAEATAEAPAANQEPPGKDPLVEGALATLLKPATDEEGGVEAVK